MFRPARRVSWGTRIFAFLVLLLAVGAVGAFLEVVLPQRVAALAQLEGNELNVARKGTADIDTSVTRLWTDLSPRGSISLSADQLSRDLTLSKQTEQAVSDTLGHTQAAENYLGQADGLPFQFHAPAFLATDRPALQHIEKALGAASKLAHGATLQITLAQHLTQDAQTLASLNASVDSRDWTGAARTASTLTTELRAQQGPATDPEALLDPLWAKWLDGMLAVTSDAQQYALAAAANQPQQAEQDAQILANARGQVAASFSAAQSDAATWQAKTIQPLVDTMTKELASGS